MNQRFWHKQQTVRMEISLLKAFYFTLGVGIFLFVLSHIGGALYASHLAARASGAFHDGITSDLAHLKKEGDELAKNDTIKEYVIARDTEKLVDFLKKEIIKRKIGLAGVTDSNGVVISRTKSVGVVGDNVFLVNAVGRIVALGGSAESVEDPFGFDPQQILLNTGRPIMRDNSMIGALFANYLADDSYAVRFRDAYLPRGVEVVFYNKEGGVYGNSFSDPDTRKLISSYFNSGSRWIQDGNSGETLSFANGDFYLVEDIIFPGLEKSPGGALLFIPRKDFSGAANLLTMLIILSTFIFVTLRHRPYSRREVQGWIYYIFFALASVLIAALSLSAFHLEKIGYLRLERIPYPLYNSTLRFQPESGIYDKDFEQRYSIVVDTGDESINAVQIGLIFDPEAVEMRLIDASGSACSYVVENIIDNHAGKGKLSCVILNSTEERDSLKIADVVLTPRRQGTFTLSFDDKETRVLANDGLGTDVLRVSQSGSYSVADFDQASSSTSTTAASLVVFSPTHPNQSRWYNEKNVHFVWRSKPGAVYKYAFDSSPDTVPSDAYTTQDPSVVVPILGDGIYYFHLQEASGGPVVHYRVQADRTPPSITSIKLSSDIVLKGDVLRASFDGEDVGSGIQNNYYIDLGNHLFLPVGSQLFIPFLEAGDSEMILRVYDKAGNYSEKKQTIHVENK